MKIDTNLLITQWMVIPDYVFRSVTLSYQSVRKFHKPPSFVKDDIVASVFKNGDPHRPLTGRVIQVIDAKNNRSVNVLFIKQFNTIKKAQDWVDEVLKSYGFILIDETNMVGLI